MLAQRSRCAPSPRWGEGWGEGATGPSRETLTPHPTPLPMGEGADRVCRRPELLAPLGLEIDVDFHADRERVRLRHIDENFDHIDVGHVALPTAVDAALP